MGYFVAYSRHYPGIYMVKPSKITKTTSSIRCTSRDSKEIHTERKSVALRLHHLATRCTEKVNRMGETRNAYSILVRTSSEKCT
jgi:beta-lactamase superfamily II metal-dependent hydrolase